VICAPEANGSIPPVLTSAITWLLVADLDVRRLFKIRPVAIASHSGGGGAGVLEALRLMLAHLGAHVVGRQLIATAQRPATQESIDDRGERLRQMDLQPPAAGVAA
jgi:NAD(P)H-dependent FMN reductase